MSFSSRRGSTRFLATLVFAIAIVFAAPSQAQQRYVVINGEFLSPEQLFV